MLDDGNVVLGLQIERERRAVAEIAAEAHRRIDRAASVQDIGDASRWHADVEREPIGGRSTHASTGGQGGRQQALFLSRMVIDSLNIAGVAVAELEWRNPGIAP